MVDLKRLRKSSVAIYAAVDESVAKDVSEQMRAAAHEIERLRGALEPFARAYRVFNALPQSSRDRYSDEDGARDVIPGAWPTIGDLRQASELLPKNL